MKYDFFEKKIDRIAGLIPERLTGNRQEMRKRMYKLYGGAGEQSADIDAMRLKTARNYVLIAAASLLLFFAGLAAYLADGGGALSAPAGAVYEIARPEDGEAKNIELRLEALAEDGSREKRTISLKVLPEGFSEEEEETERGLSPGEELSIKINTLIKRLGRDSEGESLRLPTEIGDGIRLNWSRVKNTNFLFALIFGVFSAFVNFFGRYDALKKREKREKESIVRELPQFLNKLVLMLNAGLVLTEAFERIAAAYEKKREEGGEKIYFYEQLLLIKRDMAEANTSLIAALRDFSARCGIREMMRLSNILSDNVGKGSGLVEKLRAESEMLWHERKKNAEEAGKVAETKMTMPLALLLMSLVLICVAPALMEM